MILHHRELTDVQVFSLLRSGAIVLAGHRRTKIYGRLDCRTGRSRMHRQNRVFFGSEAEAIQAGYRPCAVCMPEAYKVWKALREEQVFRS